MKGSIYLEPRYNRKGVRGTGMNMNGGHLVRGVGWVRGTCWRWCADVRIGGKRYRKRSADFNVCLFFLQSLQPKTVEN